MVRMWQRLAAGMQKGMNSRMFLDEEQRQRRLPRLLSVPCPLFDRNRGKRDSQEASLGGRLRVSFDYRLTLIFSLFLLRPLVIVHA